MSVSQHPDLLRVDWLQSTDTVTNGSYNTVLFISCYYSLLSSVCYCLGRGGADVRPP